MSRKLLAFLLLVTAFVCLPSTVNADLRPARNWREGFEQMCQRIPAECASYDDDRRVIEMSMARWSRLIGVNRAVNREVVYQSDKEHYGVPEYFAYPTDGYGDCEDFALEKRRRLVAMGWPRRALLLIVVDAPKQDWDELHIVLAVKTSRGTLILDNRHKDIRPLSGSEYVVVSSQSADDPKIFSKGAH